MEIEAGGLRLRVETADCVYPPGEDSILAVETMLAAGRAGLRARSVADLGTGTGVLALAAHKIFRPDLVAATDINPLAVLLATRNLRGTGALVARCFVGRCLRPGWDLVVANPPYLPVQDELPGECGYYDSISWGWPGMVREFCVDAARLSSGAVVLVYSSLSGFNPLECLEDRGFRVRLVFERRFFMETIYSALAVREGRWSG